MKNIALYPRNLDSEIAEVLERKELITFIRHPSEEFRKELKNEFYKKGDFKATFHSFHSVTITYTDIFLASHPAGYNEIVMLWDSCSLARPLYFVFSLWKINQYLEKLKNQEISENDFMAVKIPYNHPQLSSFIVWGETVHCELTNRIDFDLPNPSFFVLEPDPLLINRTNESKYGIQLILKTEKNP